MGGGGGGGCARIHIDTSLNRDFNGSGKERMLLSTSSYKGNKFMEFRVILQWAKTDRVLFARRSI